MEVDMLFNCFVGYCFFALMVSPISFALAEDFGLAGEKLVCLNNYKWHTRIMMLLKSFLTIGIVSLIFCIPSVFIILVLLAGLLMEEVCLRLNNREAIAIKNPERP